ncbi:MAG: pyrroline-5-carboxylate reductase [Alphaproteobacteria bacterium]|nr:pyrroline-5-carboxylate reductase [Alphaproteobacteria bacterium]MCY4229572.1 pyrroline-5-carboxylate reductase [Alphaproteobacteria bacterium]MCY4320183.1 pyrroline-5-carboxylate reductase [Alphaproteobacteria bacterium]
MSTPDIILAGCGKMGGALLAGWLEQRFADQIVVVEPDEVAAQEFQGKPGVHITSALENVTDRVRPDAVIFAVKPQIMSAVVPAYKRYTGHGAPVFLSIAAGTPIALLENMLGRGAAVVRAMPNTPAAVGRGIASLIANQHVDPAQMALCQTICEAVGEVVWLGDESIMDAVTAVSGSGPAYVFYLVEALAAAGQREGLPEDMAMRLARATVSGAGELLNRSPEAADTLRRNVTSPGGTTAAALDVLMADDGLAALMRRAVAAAANRSRALGS